MGEDFVKAVTGHGDNLMDVVYLNFIHPTYYHI